ncbi:MAG: MATE family efflux transporter [Lachnospiraceae bacterium]|jgi:putative MATE family efflux protein|nr:MATE family efflux transporter [Lachnospiraceae bacterium]
MANRDLTVGEPGRVIRSYCLPLFGSVFFQQMYNLADSFVAGRFINENALAAVGNSYEITMIFLAFAVGCNTGCSVIVSRYFGAKDYKKVKTGITTSFIVTAIVCLLFMAGGLLFASPILRLIRTPADIFQDSLAYLQIYIGGLFFVFFYNVANGVFSALGDSKTPFIFLAVSSTANIAMDILFVAVFDWGVIGVALATFICQGAACIPALAVMAVKMRRLSKTKAPWFTSGVFKEFTSVAIPSVLQQGFVAAGNIIIQSVVNTYGAAVVAGYSAAVKMNNLVTSCFTTIGSGVTNYTSQNLGAGKPERIKAGFKGSVRFMWTIAISMCLLYFLFPAQLIRVFLNQPSQEALQSGVDFLRIASPFYIAAAFKITCDSFLCGAKRMGYVVFSIFLDLGLRAAIAIIFSALFQTAFSVWFAWPIGWTIAAVVTYQLYRRKLGID